MFCRKRKLETNLIFVRDMIVEMGIGIYDEEKGRRQRVRINVKAEPKKWPDAAHDNIEQTLSYEAIIKHIGEITQSRHFNLVETVADMIASACLGDGKIRKITVSVEKLDAYPFTIPGVEIVRVKR